MNENEKVAPSPSVLSAQASPPMRLARDFEMARPRPEPPCWRVVVESTCEKVLNRRLILEAAMPGPVSLTLTVMRSRSPTASALEVTSTIAPELCGQNLQALDSRLSLAMRRGAIEERVKGRPGRQDERPEGKVTHRICLTRNESPRRPHGMSSATPTV